MFMYVFECKRENVFVKRAAILVTDTILLWKLSPTAVNRNRSNSNDLLLTATHKTISYTHPQQKCFIIKFDVKRCV